MSGLETVEMVWTRNRIDDLLVVSRVLMAVATGTPVRGIVRFSLLDGVKVTLGSGGMTVRTA